jgi:hypothetical protein
MHPVAFALLLLLATGLGSLMSERLAASRRRMLLATRSLCRSDSRPGGLRSMRYAVAPLGANASSAFQSTSPIPPPGFSG